MCATAFSRKEDTRRPRCGVESSTWWWGGACQDTQQTEKQIRGHHCWTRGETSKRDGGLNTCFDVCAISWNRFLKYCCVFCVGVLSSARYGCNQWRKWSPDVTRYKCNGIFFGYSCVRNLRKFAGDWRLNWLIYVSNWLRRRLNSLSFRLRWTAVRQNCSKLSTGSAIILVYNIHSRLHLYFACELIKQELRKLIGYECEKEGWNILRKHQKQLVVSTAVHTYAEVLFQQLLMPEWVFFKNWNIELTSSWQEVFTYMWKYTVWGCRLDQ